MNKIVTLASAALGLVAACGITYVYLPGGSAPVSQSESPATTQDAKATPTPSEPSGTVVDEEKRKQVLNFILPANAGALVFSVSVKLFGVEQNTQYDQTGCELTVSAQPVCPLYVPLNHDGMTGTMDVALVPHAADFNKFTVYAYAENLTRHEKRKGPKLSNGFQMEASVLVKEMDLGSPHFRKVGDRPSASTSFQEMMTTPVRIPFNYKKKDGTWAPAGVVSIGLSAESYNTPSVGLEVADVFAD